jgi:hypothetical protein
MIILTLYHHEVIFIYEFKWFPNMPLHKKKIEEMSADQKENWE